MMKAEYRKRPGSRTIRTTNHIAIPKLPNLNQAHNITVDQAQKILFESGINIEKDDAAEVLELMYQLAKLIVNQNFKK